MTAYASSSGDTITVLPGVYRETIRFKGKAITVVGSGTSGVNETTIDADFDEDGEGDFTAVIFMNGEGPTSILKNLRIVNGQNRQISHDPNFPTFSFASKVLVRILAALGSEKPPTPNGGGIICFNSSPTIENCVIENCTTEGSLVLAAIGAEIGSGGGVAVVAKDGGIAAPTFKDCIIRNNSTGHGWSLLLDIDGGHGAGVYCNAEDVSSTAHVTLEDCQIVNNVCGFADGSAAHGGGIAVIGVPNANNTSLIVRRCEVSNNAAGMFNGKVGNGGNGGGLYLRDVTAGLVLEDINFLFNEAGASTRAGAQVNFTITDPPLAADTHSGFGGDGGGLYYQGTVGLTQTLLLNRCTFGGNAAGSSYACFSPSSAGDVQVNNGGNGGGVFIGIASTQDLTVNLVNCFLIGNTTGSGVGVSATDIAGNGGAFSGGSGPLTSFRLNVNSSTICDNQVGSPSNYLTGGYGQGVYLAALFGGNTQVDVRNSILYHNGPLPIFVNNDVFSTITAAVNHSNIEGGWVGPGAGNIAADPVFVNRFVDYHLAAGSPCIDAGSSSWVDGIQVDYDGDARVIGDSPDMGADESTTPGTGTSHPWPGSQEDLLLTTRINGLGIPTAPVKTALPFDFLSIDLLTPGQTFVGAQWVLAAAIFPDGQPPAPTPSNPDVHILNGGFELASSSSPLGNVLMGPAGMSFPPAQLPVFLSGQNILLQGFVFSPQTASGFYSASDGHEIKVQ